MKKILSILAPALIAFSLFSCQSNEGKDKTEETPAAEQADEHAREGAATFTIEQIRSIGIETGPIEEKQLVASIRANGALRVPNQNKASINSLYSGIVQSLLIQPGNTVSKGQVIATIANPDFIRMQEEYLAITPKLVLARQEVDRQQELNQGNAGALKNLQAAESELRALNTRQSALDQQLRLMGINPGQLSNGKLVSVVSLRTPIGGIVSSVSVKMGSYIDVTTPVAEVVDNSQLHLDLFVYEKDLPKLKNHQNIHFTVTNNPGREYDAQIYSLGSTFEDESKAVSVHARVQGDKSGLIDGMNITALISLDRITTPAVPNDAIVTYQGQNFIFMVANDTSEADHPQEGKAHDDRKQQAGKATNAPGDAGHKDHDDSAHEHEQPVKNAAGGLTFVRVPVARGTSEVGYTQITLLKSIPPGAQIVTKGAFFVLAKITNAGEEGGHAH